MQSISINPAARAFGPSGSGPFGFGHCFGSVAGRCGLASSPKPRPKPKILAPRRRIISVNTLVSARGKKVTNILLSI
jgi:hypothetical protein